MPECRGHMPQFRHVDRVALPPLWSSGCSAHPACGACGRGTRAPHVHHDLGRGHACRSQPQRHRVVEPAGDTAASSGTAALRLTASRSGSRLCGAGPLHSLRAAGRAGDLYARHLGGAIYGGGPHRSRRLGGSRRGCSLATYAAIKREDGASDEGVARRHMVRQLPLRDLDSSGHRPLDPRERRSRPPSNSQPRQHRRLHPVARLTASELWLPAQGVAWTRGVNGSSPALPSWDRRTGNQRMLPNDSRGDHRATRTYP